MVYSLPVTGLNAMDDECEILFIQAMMYKQCGFQAGEWIRDEGQGKDFSPAALRASVLLG